MFVLTTAQAKQLGGGTRIKSKYARTSLYSWAWQSRSTTKMRTPTGWTEIAPWRGVFSASVFVLTTTQAKQLGGGTRVKSKYARTFLYSWAWQKKNTTKMRTPEGWKEIAPWRGVFFSFGARPDNNASQTAGRGDAHKIKVCKDLLVLLGLAKQKHNRDANTNRVERDRTLARCFFSVGVRPDNNASQTTGWGGRTFFSICKDLRVLQDLRRILTSSPQEP